MHTPPPLPPYQVLRENDVKLDAQGDKDESGEATLVRKLGQINMRASAADLEKREAKSVANKLEAGFRRITLQTGVTELDEIVKKIMSAHETQNLLDAKAEAAVKELGDREVERDNLIAELNMIKVTGGLTSSDSTMEDISTAEDSLRVLDSEVGLGGLMYI